MPALFYRIDNVRQEFEDSEPFRRLYVALRDAGYEVKTERSNITRGWTYNSPMWRMDPIGGDNHRFVPMGAGSGLNPMLAMLDAAYLTRVRTPKLLVAILEAETWLLVRAQRIAAEREKRQAIERQVHDALDDLTAVLGMVKSRPAATQPKPAKPDEDDDL